MPVVGVDVIAATELVVSTGTPDWPNPKVSLGVALHFFYLALCCEYTAWNDVFDKLIVS